MRIQLPVETWIEVLDWLRRKDLLKKLDQLWDREFTPIIQEWLHVYTRNVKIENCLNIDDKHLLSIFDATYIYWKQVPMAQVEMPENVTGFKRIDISYLESSILAFLRRMRPLFHNIHLKFSQNFQFSTQQAALRHLMPLFSDRIESICLDYQMLQFFSTAYSTALFNAKLLQIHNYLKSDDNDEQIFNWLFTKRVDDLPRVIQIFRKDISLWAKIRERFMDPARQCACPFFVRTYMDLPPNESVLTENSRTGEQLTIQPMNDDSFQSVLISNCPQNVDPEWLVKQAAEVCKWSSSNEEQQTIWLGCLEIGSFDDDEDANQPLAVGNGEE